MENLKNLDVNIDLYIVNRFKEKKYELLSYHELYNIISKLSFSEYKIKELNQFFNDEDIYFLHIDDLTYSGKFKIRHNGFLSITNEKLRHNVNDVFNFMLIKK